VRKFINIYANFVISRTCVDKVTNPLPFTFVVSETVAEFETHGNICILANYYFLP